MPANFSLKPLPALTFGAGSITSLPRICRSLGSRFIVITGAGFRDRTNQWPSVEKELLQAGGELFYTTIDAEPTPEIVDRIVRRFRALRPDAVISIGGGSVLDGGKAVSAMLPSGEPVMDFLEGVGHRTPDGTKTPFIAVPTTAGTGSEATANSVITRAGAGGFKKSLRHDRYVPDYAVVDPDLMRTCPQDLTASCAMDTFTQLVEGYLSTNASGITDAIAWEGLKNISTSLREVYRNGDDIDARTDIAFASLCSGIVLANAGLGIIHGLAPPLGCLFSVPHGSVCGTLMASGNRKTREKLAAADPGDHAQDSSLAKYGRLDSLFCGIQSGGPSRGAAFVDYLQELTRDLRLPRLSRFGVTADHLDTIVAGASNKNNPARLDAQAIREIVAERL